MAKEAREEINNDRPNNSLYVITLIKRFTSIKEKIDSVIIL